MRVGGTHTETLIDKIVKEGAAHNWVYLVRKKVHQSQY